MQTPSQAPAGGAYSRVNGERYEGGQFMPIHGEFCGQAFAAARKVARRRAITDIRRSGGYRLEGTKYSPARRDMVNLHTGTFETAAEAEAFRAQAEAEGWQRIRVVGQFKVAGFSGPRCLFSELFDRPEDADEAVAILERRR